MKIDRIETVIAKRELTLPEGKIVTVLIGKPTKFPDSEDYYCPYHIAGLGNENYQYARGIDAVQSIYLALKKIGTNLYTSEQALAGVLRWNDERDLGFPVPDSIRDQTPEPNKLDR
jgi:hypothetical protein